MQIIQKLLVGIDKLNEWVAKTVSWVVVLIVAATFYEVIMRYVFNAPTNWVFEFNYLAHGPYFLLLGAYTFAQVAMLMSTSSIAGYPPDQEPYWILSQ